MKLTNVNQDNFSDFVLNSEKTVIVDFWAEWCGPCKTLGPVLENLSSEISDKATIVKLNVDESRELATRYGIRGIPTMLFFKGGKVVSTLVGNHSKDIILASLEGTTSL